MGRPVRRKPRTANVKGAAFAYPGLGRWGSRLLLVALLAAGLSPPGQARGDDPDPAVPESSDGPAWDTFNYVKPAPVLRLRLGGEEAGAIAIATVGYLIVDPPPSLAGVPTPIRVWQKLTFQPGTWSFEADPYGTNLEGHAAGGTVYYLIARGNRVSIPEAFAWTFGAALMWELVEFREPVSINDLIMTPAGGLAIGEALTQLSGWFDRSGSNGLHKAFAWILDFPKKLHDWMDGAHPVVDPVTAGWHEFQVFGAAGFLQQGSRSSPYYGVYQFGIQTRLFRVPDYGAPGRGQTTFVDGRVSRITLGWTFNGAQLVDSIFDTETSVVGHYARDIQGTGEEPRGWDVYLGMTAGYETGQHVWNVAEGSAPNRVAIVRLPGLVLQPRLFQGKFELDLGLETALLFGGVDPLRSPPVESPPPGVAYPPVLVSQGYYYALGLRIAPSIQVRYGELAIGAMARLDEFHSVTTGWNAVAIDGRMPTMVDRRGTGIAWARIRLPNPPLEFGLRGEWSERAGSVDDVSASQQERVLAASLSVMF